MDELRRTTITTETRAADCETHGGYESTAFKLGARIMHWSSCPACAGEARAEELAKAAQEEAAVRQRQLETRLSQSGIPQRYRSKTFVNFIATDDAMEQALATAMRFAQDFDQHSEKGTFMVFSGPPGTGKSHLATAIAQAVLAGGTAMYTSAIDAVRLIRDTWRRNSERTESQVLAMLASIDLLILDEVGVQYGTEAEQVNLFDIIDKRYRDKMPTILLTNQNRSGLKQFLGDRSFDRLREGGIWVTFDWGSQRGAVPA
jgi:DNA replication protein DnaC